MDKIQTANTNSFKFIYLKIKITLLSEIYIKQVTHKFF